MLVIKDANIWIDLFKSGLIEYFIDLQIETYITDFVVESEITDGRQQLDLQILINKGSIKVLNSSVTDLEQIIAIKMTESNRLSLSDCSNLYFAMKMKAILLTNDNLLRKTSLKYKIEVHGILWLFDLWVERKIFTTTIAAEKLGLLADKNPWLPVNEINKRLTEWGAKDEKHF